MQISVDRRKSGVLVVKLVGAPVAASRDFVSDRDDPHRFASYTIDGWSRARIVPCDHVGYAVEVKMIQEVRAVAGLMVPPPAESLIDPMDLLRYHVRMATQAFQM